MKNVILGVIAKISAMDAETKQLTARVEAQALLLSALLLAIGKEGGVEEVVESVKKAINATLELADTPLKSDAEILLNEFSGLLVLSSLIDKSDSTIEITEEGILNSSEVIPK